MPSLPPSLPLGILLIDKTSGITSFDVIRKLRKATGIRKIGHAGTLDPLATGLLIIGAGRATKLLNTFLKMPKTYRVDILLGKRTTTGDLEGEVIEEMPVERPDPDAIRREVEKLKGTHRLPVPIFSAVKIAGIPLYKRARKGDTTITPPVKEMIITEISLISHGSEKEEPAKSNDPSDHGTDLPRYRVTADMNVSSGTYVRSIAEELGRRLGFPATVSALRRTSIGPFHIEDALPIESAYAILNTQKSDLL